MSLSRRDSPFANSGLVVAISVDDLARLGLPLPLGGAVLQRRLERAAAAAGGGELRAPATRATDFLRGRGSSTVPATSYQPGLAAGDLAAVLDATGLPLAAGCARRSPHSTARCAATSPTTPCWSASSRARRPRSASRATAIAWCRPTR